jgi:DNA-binding PadR family transcriptional regulator
MSGLSTKHLVLGLVVEKTQTHGYALRVQADRRFGFLHLSSGAVYNVLRRLRRDGLIEAVDVESDDGVFDIPRQPYRATAEGVAAFREWMAAPSERPLVRDELQAKLGLASSDDLPDLLMQAEAQLAACIAEMSGGGSDSALTTHSSDTTWPVAARILAEDFHSQMLSGTVDWLTSTIEVIKMHIARQAKRQT